MRSYERGILAGMVLSAALFVYQGFQKGWDFERIGAAHRISDATSLAGILLLAAGLLSFAFRRGGFDAAVFSHRKIHHAFGKRRREKNPTEEQLKPEEATSESYYDFVQKQKSKESGAGVSLLLSGAGFILIGILAVFFV